MKKVSSAKAPTSTRATRTAQAPTLFRRQKSQRSPRKPPTVCAVCSKARAADSLVCIHCQRRIALLCTSDSSPTATVISALLSETRANRRQRLFRTLVKRHSERGGENKEELKAIRTKIRALRVQNKRLDAKVTKLATDLKAAKERIQSKHVSPGQSQPARQIGKNPVLIGKNKEQL